MTGLEPSNDLYKVAQEHLDGTLSSRVNYKCETIETFAAQSENANSFDAVILSEVIEHVNQPDSFLAECLKPLKPGGSLFITTFNRTVLSWLGGIFMAEHLLKIVPLNTHQWDKFITPEETQRMLEKCE